MLTKCEAPRAGYTSIYICIRQVAVLA